jgi:hypothetical protein
MNSNITAFTKRIHPIAWQVICLAASVLVFVLILVSRSPVPLRPLGMSLRSGFGVVIPLTALVMYAVFRIPGRWGQLISLTAVLSLFALGLAGVWASGLTQSILLSGLIPLSDAVNYYVDALRILHGMNIGDFSAMRPFFAGFLSLLLWLTGGNLMAAAGILTGIAAISCHLASREIQRTHGPEAAVLFLMLMFLYFRHHSGTTMSESLGVSISLLGVALIWRGTSEAKQWAVLSGIGMIALALNVRPGAMFVLPALLLWGAWVFRGGKALSLKFLALGAGLTLAVFALNRLMITLLAGADNAAFSNFSWALYGLASGGNSWNYVFEAHPELSLLSDEEVTPAIYRLAIELMIRQPSLLVKGALHFWGMFFSNTWYNAYSFAAGNNYWVNEAARWGLYLLNILGIVKWLKDRKDPSTNLALFAALGVLASVPFVPPTHAYRVRLYAATIPFFALLPAMGLSWLRERFSRRPAQTAPSDERAGHAASILSVVLIMMMTTAPLLIKAEGETPPLPRTVCLPGMDSVVIRFDRGTSVNVLRENIVFLDRMPDFHASVFRRNAHDLADSHLIGTLTSVNPPRTLFYSLDLESNGEALIVAPTGALPQYGIPTRLCGYWEDDPNVGNYRIFYAESAAESP